MKINHANVTGTGASGPDQVKLDKTGKAAAAVSGASAATGNDRIELSGLGRQLRLLAAESPERAARLEKLAAAVSSGTYEVDAGLLSRRLIAEALEDRGA